MTLAAGLAGRRLARADLTEPEQKAGERTIDMVVGALRFRVPAAYLPSFIQSDSAPVRHVPSFAFAFMMPGPTPLTPEENRDLVETRRRLRASSDTRRLIQVVDVREIPDHWPDPETLFMNETLTHPDPLPSKNSTIPAEIMIAKSALFNGVEVIFLRTSSKMPNESQIQATLGCFTGNVQEHLCDGAIQSEGKTVVIYVLMAQRHIKTFAADIAAAMRLITSWLIT